MTVLVVEDEKHIMRLIEVNFQRDGDKVLKAFTAADALVIAEQERPDLVIIDQTLPDIQGDELARVLHARNPAPALLLMFPRGGVQESWVQGWVKPANAFITKPFDSQELVAFARRILLASYPDLHPDGNGERS